MRIASLELILAPRVRARDGVTRPDRMQWVYPLLAELAGILRGQPWMVVSGLAIPLHSGSFYRGHKDVDIGVPLPSLPAVAALMRGAGFALTRRLAMLHVSRRTRLEVHRHTRADAAAALRNPRHLRFWRRAGISLQPAPYIDVFPYIETERDLVILQCGSRIPRDGPLWKPVRLPCGTEVPVERLVHVAHQKAGGERARDELDRRMLRARAAAR